MKRNMKTTSKIIFSIPLIISMFIFAFFPFVRAEAAGKVSVNVLTEKVQDGTTEKFTYNKSGLLVKSDTISDDGNTNLSIKITYKKNLVSKITRNNSGYKDVTVFSYNKKKQVAKRTSKDGDFKTETSYTYDKKGRVTKKVCKESGPEAMGTPLTEKYTYKNGNIVKDKCSGFNDDVITYSYDKSGYLTGYKTKYSNITFTNSYDENNLLTGISLKNDSFGEVITTEYTLKYKTISVPKKLAEKVKKQQKELINNYAPQFEI